MSQPRVEAREPFQIEERQRAEVRWTNGWRFLKIWRASVLNKDVLTTDGEILEYPEWNEADNPKEAREIFEKSKQKSLLYWNNWSISSEIDWWSEEVQCSSWGLSYTERCIQDSTRKCNDQQRHYNCTNWLVWKRKVAAIKRWEIRISHWDTDRVAHNSFEASRRQPL